MEAMVAKQLVLESPGWRSPPLRLALGPRARWRGLAPDPMGQALLMWGRSVHGRSMRVALRVVRVDTSGEVQGAHVLAPGGLLWFGRAGWNLEMPLDAAVPPRGASLVVRPMLEG